MSWTDFNANLDFSSPSGDRMQSNQTYQHLQKLKERVRQIEKDNAEIRSSNQEHELQLDIDQVEMPELVQERISKAAAEEQPDGSKDSVSRSSTLDTTIRQDLLDLDLIDVQSLEGDEQNWLSGQDDQLADDDCMQWLRADFDVNRDSLLESRVFHRTSFSSSFNSSVLSGCSRNSSKIGSPEISSTPNKPFRGIETRNLTGMASHQSCDLMKLKMMRNTGYHRLAYSGNQEMNQTLDLERRPLAGLNTTFTQFDEDHPDAPDQDPLSQNSAFLPDLVEIEDFSYSPGSVLARSTPNATPKLEKSRRISNINTATITRPRTMKTVIRTGASTSSGASLDTAISQDQGNVEEMRTEELFNNRTFDQSPTSSQISQPTKMESPDQTHNHDQNNVNRTYDCQQQQLPTNTTFDCEDSTQDQNNDNRLSPSRLKLPDGQNTTRNRTFDGNSSQKSSDDRNRTFDRKTLKTMYEERNRTFDGNNTRKISEDRNRTFDGNVSQKAADERNRTFDGNVPRKMSEDRNSSENSSNQMSRESSNDGLLEDMDVLSGDMDRLSTASGLSESSTSHRLNDVQDVQDVARMQEESLRNPQNFQLRSATISPNSEASLSSPQTDEVTGGYQSEESCNSESGGTLTSGAVNPAYIHNNRKYSARGVTSQYSSQDSLPDSPYSSQSLDTRSYQESDTCRSMPNLNRFGNKQSRSRTINHIGGGPRYGLGNQHSSESRLQQTRPNISRLQIQGPGIRPVHSSHLHHQQHSLQNYQQQQQQTLPNSQDNQFARPAVPVRKISGIARPRAPARNSVGRMSTGSAPGTRLPAPGSRIARASSRDRRAGSAQSTERMQPGAIAGPNSFSNRNQY